MKKKRFLRPDFIVAILAVVIGLCTMFVYIYQAHVMSKQLEAAVWPFIEVLVSQGEKGLSLEVANKGAGPAIVRSNRLILDDQPFTEEQLDSLFVILTGKKIPHAYTTVQSRVVAAGERFTFIEVNDPRYLPTLDSALKKHTVRLELCYCSIYDQCWKVSRGKTTPCNTCE